MKMIVSVFLFLGLSFLSPISFADPVNGNTDLAANSSVNSPDAQKTDRQIIKSILVIDDNEIEAARLALKKSDNPKVKKFAQVMIDDHVKNIKELKTLFKETKIYPLTSDQSIALETEGKNGLDQLAKSPHNTFDSEYMNAMVNGHQKAANLLANELTPKASNPQLVTFLKSTSAMVSRHLELAEKTQKQLS